MGVGQVSGATPNVWYYFRPQDGNLFVLAWLAVAFLLSVTYAWWVVFAGGAQRVRELNLMAALGQQRSKPPSERTIKVFAVGTLLVFPGWLYLVVSMNAPLPKW
jgi:hypothetical protein